MLMHLGILSLVSFADLTFGMLMVHFFTFDPRWFGENPRKGEKKVVLFDGVCGMCNRSVNLLMSIDARNLLLFSPLQGEFAAREDKEDAKTADEQAAAQRKIDAAKAKVEFCQSPNEGMELYNFAKKKLKKITCTICC